MDKQCKVGFIGLGLIGGSIARALKESNKSYHLLAYETAEGRESLMKALSDKVIDEIADDTENDFSDCDMILLCAPVHINVTYINKLKGKIKSTCILSDVGSVKAPIHRAIKDAGLSAQFIGGHPMTGSEKSGYGNSNAALLENAYYILTPTKDSSSDTISFMTQFVADINSIPMLLDAEEHDDITAAISHVPHIIAAQLVNLVRTSEESDKMRLLAAGGFKDITRIASSSPAMWQNICMMNTNSIKECLLRYSASIQEVIKALDEKNANALYELFDTAGEFRSQLPNSKGILTRVYEIFLDIADQPGAIAIIATILGSNGISIKNIGIIHNREFEQGVLRIELYGEEALDHAVKILSSYNYIIYKRQ